MEYHVCCLYLESALIFLSFVSPYMRLIRRRHMAELFRSLKVDARVLCLHPLPEDKLEGVATR